jgi:chaperone modulatory protein CbpM
MTPDSISSRMTHVSNEHRNHAAKVSQDILSLQGLAELSGLSEGDLQALVEHEILSPIDMFETRWVFRSDCLVRMHKACRLRNDLELDIHAVALTIMLLDRIEALERQLSAAMAQR